MEEFNHINETDDIEFSKYDTINIDDVIYYTTIPQKNQDKKPYKPKDLHEVYAFIPGTILKIYVSKKDKVKKGDKLLVLQAMKMSNDLVAPINGVIENVFIKEGESVSKSQILIKIK